MGLAFLLRECHCGFCFHATLGFQKALPPVIKSSGFFSAGLKGLWVRISELGKKRCQTSSMQKEKLFIKGASQNNALLLLEHSPTAPLSESEPGQMNKGGALEGRLFLKQNRESCTRACRSPRQTVHRGDSKSQVSSRQELRYCPQLWATHTPLLINSMVKPSDSQK